MNPCTSAGKKPATEEILHSLGWTFHAGTNRWNFHNTSIPCLARQSILVEDVLKTMWAVLGRSMDNIENSMAQMGVTVPAMPPKTLNPPANIGAPGELHEFLDVIVDTARKQGARVQISLDPNRGKAFEPLSILEQMLSVQCPHCRGQH